MTCKHTNCFHSRAARVTYCPGVEANTIDRHHVTGEPILSVMIEARICQRCKAWLSIGPSNDSGHVRVEISAARLIAGYESANDTDDTLDDPICRDALAFMVGESNLRTKFGREAHRIHEAARETP